MGDEDDSEYINIDEFQAWVKTGIYSRLSQEAMTYLEKGNQINPVSEEAKIVAAQEKSVARGKVERGGCSLVLDARCAERLRQKMLNLADRSGGVEKVFHMADSDKSKTVDETEFGKI